MLQTESVPRAPRLQMDVDLVTRHVCLQASAHAEDGEEDTAGATYQLEMMRCLREVNADNNTVGW